MTHYTEPNPDWHEAATLDLIGALRSLDAFLDKVFLVLFFTGHLEMAGDCLLIILANLVLMGGLEWNKGIMPGCINRVVSAGILVSIYLISMHRLVVG